MHTIGMTMQQVQVNIKFLNALQSKWSKFINDVKLAKSLYTTNYDQLYAYLSQHECHDNEVHIKHERYPDSLAFIANFPTLYNPSQSPQDSDSSLVVPMFQQGEDLIEFINKAMAFLSAIASRFPPLNNQLRTSFNPRNQATIQDGRVIVGPSRVEKLMLSEAQEAGQILDEEQLAFLADPGISEGPVAHQTIPQNLAFQTDDLDAYDLDCDDLSSAKAILMANLSRCDFEVLSERFTQLMNDMHTIGMTMQQVQVNIKFLNALQSKWSKFVNNVKLAKSLYTTNYDQLYAYLSQHECHDNEVRIKHERYPDSLAFIANFPTLYNPSQSPQDSVNPVNSQQHLVSPLPFISPSMTPQSQAEFPQLDYSLIVPMFQQGEDLIEFINKEKLMLSEAQEAGQILDEEQLAFLADPGISEGPVAHQTIPQNLAFQTNDLDAYDSDCDDLSSAKAILMANLSRCDSEVLSEDTNPSAPNDLLVLSLAEKMTDRVAHLDKENQTNKMVNELLTTELERYKERITIFKQRLNIDLNQREKLIDSQMDDLIRDRNAKLAALQQEIDTLKETLSNNVKEKDSLSQTLTVFKTKSKEKESKDIDFGRREYTKMLDKQNDPISIEKKIKISPIDYSKLNKIKEDFEKRFVTKKELSAEQSFWLKHSSLSETPVTSPLKNELRKIKGKNVINTVVSKPNATLAPRMFKLDIEPISARLKKNKDAHEVYIEKTIEYANTLHGFVKRARTQYPRVKPTTSASRSKPSGNTKNNKITRPPRSNQKNKEKDHPRKVKSSLNKINSISEPINNALVKHSVRNDKFKSMCAICNKCLFNANQDICLVDFMNDVNLCSKPKSNINKKRKAWKPTDKVFTDVGFKWKPTVRFFTIVGNSCPLTKKIVHLKETTPNSAKTLKPKIKVYSMRPKQIKSAGSSNKAKIVESKITNNSEPTHLWGSNATDVPSSSSLVNDRYCLIQKFPSCKDNRGVDLLSGSRDTNLYTISLDDMLKTSSIYLLSKTLKNKSWLRHHRLLHLNFGTLNKLAKDGLARGIPKLKFQKDHMCSACALGKSKKSSHQPKAEDTNQEKLYLLHINLCVLMRVESINGKSRSCEDLGKLNAKADIGIFVGYMPTKKVFDIYNRRTKKIIETIHVTFDELTSMASEQFGSGPGLQIMTPVTSIPVAAAPRAVKIVDSPVSTSIGQDAPSSSIPSTQDQEHSPTISQGVEESPKTPLFHDDPLHDSFYEDSTSQGSSSNMIPSYTLFEIIGRWTKDYLIENVISDPSRSVSTRKQLKTDAMWCYFDAFLTSVEPKNFKQAMIEPS
nr:integrase, catalytic region, zinc finger, CCHC-type, peptidase aspartic, catalytic [Tanacetum cinerariifolium]